MSWSILLRNRAGTNLSELRNATARSFRFPLNRTPTGSFTIQADNAAASLFTDVDKLIVAVYDDSTGTKTLRMQGPVVGYQKQRQSGSGSIAVTFAGLQWRLDHRLIGKNVAGATFGTNATALLDRGEIMGRIIDALNAGEATNVWTDAGDTGIRRGTITASAGTYVDGWRYKLAGEAFSDLTGTLDSPDWQVSPVEPYNDGVGVVLGTLNVSPVLGVLQPNVVFEFGTGRGNVEQWVESADATGIANRAISLPSGYPDNAVDTPTSWDDAAAITDRGLFEAVVGTDLVSNELRTRLVQDAVTVRKVPRRIISFTPVAEDSAATIENRRVPRLFADYSVGDTVVFRAIERFPVYDTAGTVVGTNEVPTTNLLLRVFVAQVDLDDNGVASTTLGLQAEGS